MSISQRAVRFSVGDDTLYGIVTLPGSGRTRGVLVVVGGPQYRVGSHRQFLLLAQQLAGLGTPVMRFDYRGMGDSEGDARTFEEVDDDLRAALDRFFAEVPHMTEVVIWGLCDGASAALFYAHRDPRVTGLVLLNPWVRTEGGEARAYLKHYYLGRLTSPELWQKILRGQFSYRAAFGSFAAKARQAIGASPSHQPVAAASAGPAQTRPAASVPLPQRMQEGLARFKGRVLVILSGKDLTAQEFTDLVGSSSGWQALLKSPRVTRQTLAEANHTFSQDDWRCKVAGWTAEWIGSW